MSPTDLNSSPISLSATAERLKRLIEQSAALLPAQGPITAFAFLNPLEALEELPFDDGIQRGARLYGCEPYLPEERYREIRRTGRILDVDLRAVLQADLAEAGQQPVLNLGTRFDLRWTMLTHSLPSGDEQELAWVIAETDALDRCRPEVRDEHRNRWVDAAQRWVMRELLPCRNKPAPEASEGRLLLQSLLEKVASEPFEWKRIDRWSAAEWERLALHLLWHVCLNGTQQAGDVGANSPPLLRYRDALWQATSQDADALVLRVLGPFTAAFIDQGLSTWRMPSRSKGLLACFLEMYREASWGEESWQRRLRGLIQTACDQHQTALQIIEQSLVELGVRAEEWDDFIPATLLAFRGYAGMVWQMEVRSDRVPEPVAAGSLIEFLAIQLLLKRAALEHIMGTRVAGPITLNQLRTGTADRRQGIKHRAFQLFQVAQLLSWDLSTLAQLDRSGWRTLGLEIASFPEMQRRRLFHAAYERHYRLEAIEAFATHCQRRPMRVSEPAFQAFFCIDAREESFRRMLEETEPRVETFGNAGFFNIPIYYKGAGDAHYAAHCPIVVRPKHWIVEEVAFTMEDQHIKRTQVRKVLGKATNQFHLRSRDLTGGAILTAGVGVLASIPLVARVLFPRLTARLSRSANRLIEPPTVTRLRIERTSVEPGPDNTGIGLSLDEMVDMGERALRDPGLTSNFARLVFFFGHGSACLNNPHKSLYDCGACSGSAGGPNARAMAMILNDTRVRSALAERGIKIPSETFFVGGLHNTGNDTITYYDLDMLPSSHSAAFRTAREIIQTACQRNAHERCRRFELAPLELSVQQAHRHVEARTEDLAQTRPEYGNCTNAICFVGRRSRVRGLFLDRRSFLMSYDHEQDDDAIILGRILGAVVPVCSGINMQYTLSAMDPRGFGAGTKLPHNITSLLGVMDGAASDLRSGLPWQSVDIHEPMRLIFIIETTEVFINKVMERNPIVSRILRNSWAQLALLDPLSARLTLYEGGRFVPVRPSGNPLPEAESSAEWYRGWRDHLGFAQIKRGLLTGQPVFETGTEDN